MIRFFKKTIRLYPFEFAIGVFTAFSSSIMAWWVYTNDLTVALADQAAHTIFARLLSDSLTPGITQLGLWPPLLHVLMMPFSAFDFLYQTGLAGFVIILPFFVIGAVYFYRLCTYFTKSAFFSIIGTLIYVLNPYVLYFSVTPMMEVLFLSLLIVGTYYFVRWAEEDRLKYLLVAAIFFSFAGLARYEGLLLLPVAGTLVLVRLFWKRVPYAKIEATAVLFGVLAGTGLLFLMAYSLSFSGHPLAFMGIGDGVNWHMDRPSDESTEFDLPRTFNYLLHASYYMLSKPLALLSVPLAIFALALSRRWFASLASLLLLLIPIIAIAINMFRGSSTVMVPEFSALDDFHNVRYALTWIAFSAFSIALLPSAILQKWRSWFSVVLSVSFSVLMLWIVLIHFYKVVYGERFVVIKSDRSAGERIKYAERFAYIENGWKIDKERGDSVAMILKEKYDFGYILVNRFGNDYLIRESALPLKNFIYEGNYKYYDQALESPWFFARFVVMADPKSLLFDGQLSQVTKKLWDSKELEQWYESVYEYEGRHLYKIRDEVFLSYVLEQGLNPEKIPSLSPQIMNWDPDIIQQTMNARSIGK